MNNTNKQNQPKKEQTVEIEEKLRDWVTENPAPMAATDEKIINRADLGHRTVLQLGEGPDSEVELYELTGNRVGFALHDNAGWCITDDSYTLEELVAMLKGPEEDMEAEWSSVAVVG